MTIISLMLTVVNNLTFSLMAIILWLLSGMTFIILTDSSYQDRLQFQKEFFNSETSHARRKDILEDAKITHIYADDKSSMELLELLEKEDFPITSIFNNQKASIYKAI